MFTSRTLELWLRYDTLVREVFAHATLAICANNTEPVREPAIDAMESVKQINDEIDDILRDRSVEVLCSVAIATYQPVAGGIYFDDARFEAYSIIASLLDISIETLRQDWIECRRKLGELRAKSRAERAIVIRYIDEHLKDVGRLEFGSEDGDGDDEEFGRPQHLTRTFVMQGKETQKLTPKPFGLLCAIWTQQKRHGTCRHWQSLSQRVG